MSHEGEALRYTVGVEQKRSDGNYGADSFSLYQQFDLPPGTDPADPAAAAAIESAFSAAHHAVTVARTRLTAADTGVDLAGLERTAYCNGILDALDSAHRGSWEAWKEEHPRWHTTGAGWDAARMFLTDLARQQHAAPQDVADPAVPQRDTGLAGGGSDGKVDGGGRSASDPSPSTTPEQAGV